jgi:hypothetical protein
MSLEREFAVDEVFVFDGLFARNLHTNDMLFSCGAALGLGEDTHTR